MIRFSILAATLCAAVALPVSAQTMSPSAIVANSSAFDGKKVTVTGKVAQFQTAKTPMGTVAAFQLCDEKCVVVLDETNASHYSDGATATATGTFQRTFKGRMRTFNNVVLIK